MRLQWCHMSNVTHKLHTQFSDKEGIPREKAILGLLPTLFEKYHWKMGWSWKGTRSEGQCPRHGNQRDDT